jgi:hypothetical protein
MTSFSQLIDDLLNRTLQIHPLTPSASPSAIQANTNNLETLRRILAHLETNHNIEQRSHNDNSSAGTGINDGDNGSDNGGVNDDIVNVEQARFEAIVANLDRTMLTIRGPAYFKEWVIRSFGKPSGKATEVEDLAFFELFTGHEGNWASQSFDFRSGILTLVIYRLRRFSLFIQLAITGTTSASPPKTTITTIIQPNNYCTPTMCPSPFLASMYKSHAPQALDIQASTSSACLFVAYVLRTIQALKFTITWNALGDQPGGKKHKSEYINAACMHSNQDLYRQRDLHAQSSAHYKKINSKINTRLKSFRREHSRVISVRKDLLCLYQHVSHILYMRI